MLFVGIEPILLLLTCLSHDFRSVLNCLASYHWTIHNTIVFRNTHGLEPYLRLWRYANLLTPYAFFFRLQATSFQYATWNLAIKLILLKFLSFENFSWNHSHLKSFVTLSIVQNTEQSLRICVFYTWICFVERVGFEPTTWSLQSYRSSQTELTPHKKESELSFLVIRLLNLLQFFISYIMTVIY